MTRLRCAAVLLAALLPGASAATAGQQPTPVVQNGRLEVSPAASIDGAIAVAASAEPVWIGWAVPAVAGGGSSCTQWAPAPEARAVQIESTPPAAPLAPTTAVRLEGGTSLVVLIRLVSRRVERLRALNDECPLDAGGRAIHWLTALSPADSARFLDGLVDAHPAAGGAQPVALAALAALALHRDAAVDPLLDRRLAGDSADPLTRHAARWIGLARGAHGFNTLSAALNQPGSDTRRRHMLVTGLGQSREAGASDLLLRVARRDSDPSVRAEAVEWFAVQRTPGTAATLLDIIAQEQDEAVRRRAVASLGHVAEAGVPALIQLARDGAPALRREAVGTLARTTDPRARAFLEDLVAR